MSLLHYLSHALGIKAESRLKIYERVSESAGPTLTYWLEIIFSAGIATLGLVLNSPAVVIGAMLIAPLMSPIIATGLALAAGDLYLGLKSMLTLLMSLVLSVGFSAALVWMLPFHTPTSEVLARTQPNLLDLGVALLSGLAGAFVVCRQTGDAAAALPGVAVAVALMPPLCAIGFGVGAGFNTSIITGAGLLFLTNLAAIVASAFAVFLLVRMNSPGLRETIDAGILERAADDRLFTILKNTRLAQGFGHVGRWEWRAAMLVVVLALLYFPLRTSLLQVRDEVISRAAVRDVISHLVKRDTIVSQLVDINTQTIVVRIIVAAAVSPDRVKAAERELVRRTGKNATLMVQRVAEEKDIAMLRDRLSTPAPSLAIPEDLETVRKDLMTRIEEPFRQSWPADAATLTGFQVALSADRTVVQALYHAAKPLSPDVQNVLTAMLRSRLGIPGISVELKPEEPEIPRLVSKRRRK